MLTESSILNAPRDIARIHSPKFTQAIRSHHTTTKRTRPHGASSIQSITGANSTTQAVLQAALRREVRSKDGGARSIRSELESHPSRTPIKLREASVPVATAAPATSQPEKESMVTYRLPTVLPRPVDMPMVTNEMLTKLDPDLDGVALPFVKDALQNRREAMLRGIACVDTKSMVIPPSPTELSVHMLRNYPNQFVVYPTHLAIVSNTNGTGGGVVYPINALVFVAHCARLPSLPQSAALQPDLSNNLLMPIVPLRLPHPESFGKLFDYLYTKNFGRLCAALCPMRTESIAAIVDHPNKAKTALLQQIVETIRETYEIPALLEKMKYIHGVWSNVCELGIAEEGIWKCMNLAWQVLMRALSSKPRVETSRAPVPCP